jgi:uncharacterized integral membrane protein
MRFLYFLVLVLVLAPLVFFAVQNDEVVPLRLSWPPYFDQSFSQPLYLLIAAVYLLGMLSGSSLVGLLRRSFHGLTERQERKA